MSSAPIRLQIEHTLRHRVPGALSPQPRVQFPRVPTGIQELDKLLGGGLPLGALSEMVGPLCSGRTSLALAFTGQITQSARASAWIDVADAFDPESAAAAGVELARLLWVRCGADAQPLKAAQQHLAAIDPGPRRTASRMPSPSSGGGSPHPRGETRGMPEAVQALLQRECWCTSENQGAPGENPASSYSAPVTSMGENAGEARRLRKKLGTPGIPNRPLDQSLRRTLDREEQPPTDRMPSRRGAGLHFEQRHPATTMPYCAEPPTKRQDARQRRSSSMSQLKLSAVPKQNRSSACRQTWQALDQALRAADLLLSAGGFSSLVLDLSSTPPEMAWRIPLATWFRFRAAAERSRTAVVLLTQHPCARSSAELVLTLGPLQAQGESTVLTGVACQAAVSRQRFELAESFAADRVVPIRKPPQSERQAQWVQPAAWNGSTS